LPVISRSVEIRDGAARDVGAATLVLSAFENIFPRFQKFLRI